MEYSYMEHLEPQWYRREHGSTRARTCEGKYRKLPMKSSNLYDIPEFQNNFSVSTQRIKALIIVIWSAYQFTDSVQEQIDDLLADGVVTTRVVVGGVLLTGDELFGVEQLTIRARANLICGKKIISMFFIVNSWSDWSCIIRMIGKSTTIYFF